MLFSVDRKRTHLQLSMVVASGSHASWACAHLKGQVHSYIWHGFSLSPGSLWLQYMCAYHRHRRGQDHIQSYGFKYRLYAHGFQIDVSSLDLFPELQTCIVNYSLYISPWMSHKHHHEHLINIFVWAKLNLIFFLSPNVFLSQPCPPR